MPKAKKIAYKKCHQCRKDRQKVSTLSIQSSILDVSCPFIVLIFCILSPISAIFQSFPDSLFCHAVHLSLFSTMSFAAYPKACAITTVSSLSLTPHCWLISCHLIQLLEPMDHKTHVPSSYDSWPADWRLSVCQRIGPGQARSAKDANIMTTNVRP